MCFDYKFDSCGMVGSFVGLFLMSSWDFSALFHGILPTLVLSISTGTLRMQTLLHEVLSIGILSDFRYLWLILLSTAKGIRPKGRSLPSLSA